MTVWIPGTIRSAARVLRSRDARRNAWHEWERRFGGAPTLPPGPIRSVLVLCHGNICRSPFAEAWLAHRRPDLAVVSAGLEAGAGVPADPSAARVAKQFGLDLSGHRSRPLDPASVAGVDLVLAMEAAQVSALLVRAPVAAGRSFVLGDFQEQRPFSIPDPWGKPDPVFASVFARIAAAMDRLAGQLTDTGR